MKPNPANSKETFRSFDPLVMSQMRSRCATLLKNKIYTGSNCHTTINSYFLLRKLLYGAFTYYNYNMSLSSFFE